MLRWIGILSAILVVSAAIPAQNREATSQRGNAALRGSVVDQSRALLPGVAIRVKYPEIQLARASLANESGRYTVSGLLPGPVTITAELAGFETVRRQIEITPAQKDYVIDFTLPITPQPPALYRGVSAVREPGELAAEEAAWHLHRATILVETLWSLPAQEIGSRSLRDVP